METSNRLSASDDVEPLLAGESQNNVPGSSKEPSRTGLLIVNADDWGRNTETTDKILDCVVRGVVSSASAMVFMEDSERAAALSGEHAVDVGLHLNFTLPFSSPVNSGRLAEHHQRVAQFLLRDRLSQIVYHPGLARSFEYIVAAQIEEFRRIYGMAPRRVDGHHHMHLSANVFFGGLLPDGAIVRRNFTFQAGEKNGANRLYRSWQDRLLARRHRVTDYFFSLPPIYPRGRVENIVSLARKFSVEVETHPVNEAEYRFLLGGEMMHHAGSVAVARGYLISSDGRVPGAGVMACSLPRVTAETVANIETINPAPNGETPHISVCVCTYKRPQLLLRLLTELNRQKTDGLFTYSIVVVDNDVAKSGEAAVATHRSSSVVPVKYCVESRQNIALARNKVVENAEGEFVAFIDDDEFPVPEWLLRLFSACNDYHVDGVLGPVKRHFDEDPPQWMRRSRFYDRRVNPTGMRVDWHEARTGNVLLRRKIFDGDATPFRPEFRAGEDQDFFRRKIEEGRVFIWSAEAEAFEVVPPARWKRTYLLRKALLRGATAALQPNCGAANIAKSILAVAVYAIALPFAFLFGQHRFMTLLVKMCDHLGKLLILIGINPIREEYVSE